MKSKLYYIVLVGLLIGLGTYKYGFKSAVLGTVIIIFLGLLIGFISLKIMNKRK